MSREDAAGVTWDRRIARSIPAQFEHLVTAHPHKRAVDAADRCVSYGELNASANRAARAVLAAIPRATAVAVLAGRRASTLAAILGVLKAGKIVVPLDCRQPVSRMRRVLDDCRAELILTDERSVSEAAVAGGSRVQVVNVEALDARLSTDDLGLPLAPDAPACLMYTSGSTGSPRATVQTHRNLLRRTQAYTSLLQLRSDDRLTLLASCSVAQGLSSALQALLNGASLHAFDLQQLGVGALASWLVAGRITVLVATTSTFRHFARTLTRRDRFPHLRAIRLGSERILAHDFELYRRHFPRGCMLVGTLGSTEAGPIAAYAMDHDCEMTDAVPAGYPLKGATVRILDDSGGVCPTGEAGEIAVRSEYLFSGYWGDPARTAAAFIDAPDGTDGRFFRTGDVGRMRPDGCLEYLGRRDSRVKIRGFRVELEEVERALAAHPRVIEAAVIDRTENGGDCRLVAHVVSDRERALTSDVLRAHMRSLLPDYMVPSSFEFVSSLPRTASGKVHRSALAACRDGPAVPKDVRRPEPDFVEHCLESLWHDLLPHRPVTRTANFFELGGDSLLAARLCVLIEQAFHVRVPLAALTTAATIGQQGQLVRAQGGPTRWPSLVPLRATGSKPPLFCVHLVCGHVLSYRDLVRHLPPSQPVYGLQSRGLDGTSGFNTRVEDMARDYVAEIRKAFPDGPYAICGWSYGGRVAFEMARQLEQQGQSVALLALLDTRLSLGTRGRSGFLAQVGRLAAHVRAVLLGPGRLEYIVRRSRKARRVIGQHLWRALVLWQRNGGPVPRALQDVTQANKVARQDYVPRVYSGRITLFKATERHGSSRPDPFTAWAALATGGLQIHEVPGTHGSMIFEPHVQTLAGKLVECLDEAWASADPLRGRRSDADCDRVA